MTWPGKQDNDIHAAVLTLGLKFADWLIVGGNQRTTALLKALCQVIMDYQSPDMLTSADLSRNLDARLKPLISFIVACRPLSIGMGNAIRSCLSLSLAPLPVAPLPVSAAAAPLPASASASSCVLRVCVGAPLSPA